jgi:cysteine desulfurase
MVPYTRVNGDRENRLPNTSSIAFEGIDSEAVLILLDKNHICCSAGSACTTGSIHPSHVLKAMGFSNDRARGSLRFSFSRFNTRHDVEKALDVVPQVVRKLREMSAV